MMSLRTVALNTLLLSAIVTCLGLSPLAQAERSKADLARDQTSKPFQVLEFMGLQPGDTVVDLFAGNGYYSEVLSEVVGEQGKVYLHNNQAYLAFAKDLGPRVADNRLPNVEVYVRELEDFDIRSESVDMVLMVMTYHDVYFEQSGWTVTPATLFPTVKRILKPGGTLAIVDHHATPGTAKAAVQVLHRIDAEFAKTDIAARGFEFTGSSELLENPEDDFQKSVFDPQVRGKTSRFVYRFIKPQ